MYHGRCRRLVGGDHDGARHRPTRRTGGAAVRSRRRVRRGRRARLHRFTLGELVGLETAFVRTNAVRIEWQLYETDTGELHRCLPKDESHRTVAVPDWLTGLLRKHIARTRPPPCACHGRTYVFSGHRAANGAARQTGPKLVDVAWRAGVSTGTVSAVLNDSDSVAAATREKSKRPSSTSATSGAGCPGRTRRIGVGPGMRRGCSSRRLQAGTRGRPHSRPGRCRCSVNRGPGCRCEGATHEGGLTRAGCRSRRASRRMVFVTRTRR